LEFRLCNVEVFVSRKLQARYPECKDEVLAVLVMFGIFG